MNNKELNIRKTETCLGQECLTASFSFPHPASMYDPTDKRRNYIFIDVIKSGVEDTEINIRFNRFNMGLLDVVLAMSDENLKSAIRKDRFAGAGFAPLIQTPYESQLIYDYRHDETPNNEETQTIEEEDEE